MAYSTTFGYDQEEDRIWIAYAPDRPRIWITRRFAAGLVGPMAQLVERTAINNQVPGLPPQEQIRMEHRIAVQETPQGDTHYPFRVTQENREAHRAHGFVLCKTLNVHVQADSSQITMKTDQGDVNFGLSRYDTHLWLRAFRMALDNADWNLPALPAWLTEPVLPPSIQNLLTTPLPTDLDDGAGDAPPSNDAPPAPPSPPSNGTPPPLAPPPADEPPPQP